jgi:hypothetical protein
MMTLPLTSYMTTVPIIGSGRQNATDHYLKQVIFPIELSTKQNSKLINLSLKF